MVVSSSNDFIKERETFNVPSRALSVAEKAIMSLGTHIASGTHLFIDTLRIRMYVVVLLLNVPCSILF